MRISGQWAVGTQTAHVWVGHSWGTAIITQLPRLPQWLSPFPNALSTDAKPARRDLAFRLQANLDWLVKGCRNVVDCC